MADNSTTQEVPQPKLDQSVEDGAANDPNKPSKNALKKAARDAAKAKAKADKIVARTAEQLQGASLGDKEKPAPDKKSKPQKGANYNIDLKNTDQGVVTRFPPEPSGYLHIGHAKAALLNDFFAHEQYQGSLICRFDDTNPAKEKEEFTNAIIEDLALMGIRPDKTSFTSDFFQEIYDYAIQLIRDGKAFTDDTNQVEMKEQRLKRQPSKRRDEKIEDNLARFAEMEKGSPEGKRWCLRAKIAFNSANGALRDPVIYRCPTGAVKLDDQDDADIEEPEDVQDVSGSAGQDPQKDPAHHVRTGDKWKMYPTYDFACPIVDSLEGVTHALRTIEYRDRNPQYQWFIDNLKLRQVQIWDFARMNFVRTLLSKRKLAKLVDKGAVHGWEDPRFPTIRGIRRRGMTIPALREFMLKQGPSKNIVNMDWTIFWSTNKKHIDPVAPRHTAILKDRAVKCNVKGARAAPYSEMKPKHVKNPDVGLKKVWYSQTIWIEQEDAKSFGDDEEITLMNWGNAFVKSKSKSINPLHLGDITEMELELHLQGDFKKTEKKITWLSADQELIPVTLVDFDFLLNKDRLDEEEEKNWERFVTPKSEFHAEAFADCNIAEIKEDDIIQFERKGYFRCDKPFLHGQPAVFFNIPTGKIERPLFS